MQRRYFRYRTLDELISEVHRLGLADDIQFTSTIDVLLQPVKIASHTLKNALAIHPMEGCDGTLNGEPDVLTYRRYERFGRGGAALIWFEATAVVPEGRANPRQLLISERTARHLEALLNITRRAHRTLYGSDDGLLCGIQLTHSGRYSFQKPLIAFHHPVLDARQGLSRDYPILPDDYLERLEDAYVRAAAIAAKVGFDFVDIKQCHGYLLSELIAAKTRPGRYGGSFENRTRFIRNVISKIRHEIGDDILLASRINAYDGLAYEPDAKTGIGVPSPYPVPYVYGFGCDESNPLREDFTEPCKLAELLYALGVQLINISLGNPYTNPHIGRPFEQPPVDGYEAPEHPLVGVARHFRAARIIQSAVPDAIIVSTGYSWLRQFWVHAAAANIQMGVARIAGLGRTAIAYPDFARDLMEHGALDRRKVCLADSLCTALMRFKHHPSGQYPVGCVPRDSLYAPIYRDAVNTRPCG